MGFDWKHLLGKAAPGILSVLTSGGSLGAGAAIKILGSVLLKKETATEDEVAAALATNDPSILLKLKEAEFSFRQEMAKNGLRLYEIDAADRANARARQIAMPKDATPTVVAYVFVGGFISALALVLLHGVPDAVHDISMAMLGALGSHAGTVVNYYFGSSSSSKRKDEALLQAGQPGPAVPA